jgi:hypothetical protein
VVDVDPKRKIQFFQPCAIDMEGGVLLARTSPAGKLTGFEVHPLWIALVSLVLGSKGLETLG